VDVSAWQFTPEDCSSPGVPIGRPIWNTQLLILNNGMQPCAIGTPGELYIGGTPLARGYHGRPSLTAERFIPNPYGAPGTRLYRTGDLVVWREDGAIVFLGRIDAQVKINGVRIEPAEIESALQQHPNVRDCAVTAKERAGKKQLVAWIVPRDEAAFDAADLRAWAANRLPSPMVPARFLSIEVLPFTSSGKLDRRRLRDLDEHPDTRITELLRVIETLSPAEAQAQLAALG
jgi:nonribosomal peptide synthetase DhbF